MPRITALKPQKNKKFVNVYVDGKFRFGIDLDNLYKFGIKLEKEFTESELEEINKAANFSKTFNKLLNFAMSRPRSESEIENWFYRKKVDESFHKKLLEKLTKLDLLDDEKFASWWVEQRLHFRQKSKRELTYELKQKGISDSLIRKVINDANIDELALAKKHAEKKSRMPEEKLKAYLLRKGFSWEIVKKVLSGQSES